MTRIAWLQILIPSALTGTRQQALQPILILVYNQAYRKKEVIRWFTAVRYNRSVNGAPATITRSFARYLSPYYQLTKKQIAQNNSSYYSNKIGQ